MPTHICFDNKQYLHGLLNSENNIIVKLIIKFIKSLLNTFAAKHLKKQYLGAKHVSRTPEY